MPFFQNRNQPYVSLSLISLAALITITACTSVQDQQSEDYVKSIRGETESKGATIMDENGMVHLPAITLPQSSALSPESKAAQRLHKEEYWGEWREIQKKDCPIKLHEAKPEELPGIRACRAEAFKKTRWYQDAMARFKVNIEEQTIGGIVTDIYTPQAGIADKNQNRVLIHLHGGGHTGGNRWIGYVAASPIADIGKIKVVSVDYRQWPEAIHPAASDDIVAVYRELLKDYQPENIGLYGCSAGGYWAGQSVPWIERAGLPRPGAVGVFGTGIGIKGSDSMFSGNIHLGASLPTVEQVVNPSPKNLPNYFTKVDSLNEPTLLPGDYPGELAKFPPTLLVNSMRDYSVSIAIKNHSDLVKQGVEADLHLWEGLGHCFIHNPELQEAQDANGVITRFFDKHLGRSAK